jgi:hypothetical protein
MVWAILMQVFMLLPAEGGEHRETGLIKEETTTAESINWRNRRILSWADFKAAPVQTAPNAALTSTSILINYRYDDESLQFNLNCVFYPHKSWTKVKTSHILAHEQGHFDISQLYTRKLYQELKAYKFREETVDKDIQSIYQRITQEQAAYQQLYDTETNYSRNAAGQANWSQRIEKELKETAAFANYPEQ